VKPICCGRSAQKRERKFRAEPHLTKNRAAYPEQPYAGEGLRPDSKQETRKKEQKKSPRPEGAGLNPIS
jgi:hypothetical protein